jgi:6-phosphogluconolactonase (cycloisomerase 2 family)
MTLTGTSGSTAETTPLCVEVGTGTCTAASTSSGYFYILNSGGPGQIAGFSISSSALASVGSTQSVSGATAVAIAPSGENFLYVASTSSGITLYTITNGALQTGVNFNGDIQAAALAVDPSGTWLLDASGVGTLTAYPITSAGALDTSRQAQTPLNLDSLAIEHGSITISPNGAIGAVALGTTGTQIFSFSSGTLADCNKLITPTYKSAGAALSVAIDPQNRYLYIGETGSNTPPNTGNLRVFNINSACSLTEISPTAPLSSGGVSPNFILPTTSGNYVYVANGMGVGNAGNITGFSVATTSGLTMGSSVPAGAQPVGLAQDSTSDWVFEVGSSGSPYFDAYTFDSSTPGKLDSQVTSTQQATSIAIVAAPK